MSGCWQFDPSDPWQLNFIVGWMVGTSLGGLARYVWERYRQ